MEKGLEDVLSLNNTRRKDILRIHFGLIAGVYKMNMLETTAELRKLMILENVAIEPMLVDGEVTQQEGV